MELWCRPQPVTHDNARLSSFSLRPLLSLHLFVPSMILGQVFSEYQHMVCHRDKLHEDLIRVMQEIWWDISVRYR